MQLIETTYTLGPAINNTRKSEREYLKLDIDLLED
jgi:hypothetical protein